MMSCDYIVVGGGSAGSTIASRLSEDSNAQVTIFESGPSDSSPFIHMPVTYYKTQRMLRRIQLEPLKHQFDAAPTTGQAKVLGGGSSVNAMVYIRGNPQDYDRWEASGAEGWGYKDVLRYFKKAEANETFAGEAHGTSGPLSVSDQRYTSPLTKEWLKACQEAGLPYNPDFNSGVQAGCGLYQVTMRNGRRCSAAVAYLNPARKRKNLTILTGKPVIRILIEGGRAVGVQYRDGGELKTLRAEREVVVSAGAIGSPRLLLLSGVGPASDLKSVGVDVKHDLPGVGQNLQDHTDCFLIYDLNAAVSYDKYKKLRWQMVAGLEYALFRTGPVASNVCEGGAFWWGDKSDPLPDLQYHFLAGAGVEEGVDSTPSGNGCTLNVYGCRPHSRGSVSLRSADPSVPLKLDAGYLSDQRDVDVLIEGVKVGEDIMSRPSISKYIKSIHQPNKPLKTRAEYDEFVRRFTQGALHLSGACRMGSDEMAVVDPQLRVRGLEGLRVADSSIMPYVVSGNLNGPSIMIGERASDFIRGNRI
ncbi:MAG TPA: GMC family oxidoreductase N-terminal domain-containing protein [Hansschlegelia sp.]